jgi:type IV pilus assembly protein PilC
MNYEDIKVYKVVVSDPVTGGRLGRVVMATSPQMAESMIPASESDVVTATPVGELEAQIILRTHPKTPTVKDQRTFFNGMARALGLNPDLVRAMELCISGIENHYLRLAVAQIIQDLREQGEDVQTAVGRFKDVLSNDKIAMLEAGAQSGETGPVFKKISATVEKQAGLLKKVTSALVYPAIVLTIGIISVLVLSFTLFKQMKGMFAAFGTELPWITQMFVSFTDFLTAYWWIAIPAFIVLPSMFFANLNKIYQQEWAQNFVDNSKYLRMLSWKMNMARCLGGMSLLLGSNVAIQKALELTAAITDHLKIKRFFKALEEGVLSGQTIDEASQKNAVYLGAEALTFLSQIRLGSQTGNLEEVIKKMAEVYEEEVDDQVGMLSQFIEPIILMVLGGFVGLVVISVFLPMVTLYQKIM